MIEIMVYGDLEGALIRLKRQIMKDKIEREIKTRSFAKPSVRRKEKERLALRRKLEEERRAELQRERRRKVRRTITVGLLRNEVIGGGQII